MPFKPGVSGNIKGRPKGKKNPNNIILRDAITSFLQDNFLKIEDDFSCLGPRERVRFYCDLLQYAIPKFQAINANVDFDKLPDEELDRIIDKIQTSLV